MTFWEKEAGIFPEADVDLFMKATAMEGVESSLITDYTLKLLGLDICKDTIVRDEMHRGVSGGQKKRVTTGEMIVGPTKTLFMDEISTGLDSSTTYQIVKCLQQIGHLTEATIFMSLLQPAPETFNLFDDIILLSEGQIVYQGPREHIVEFFETCGFKCPERKGTADFLQEVTSKKDQEQYWEDRSKPYRYISVSEFASRPVGIKMAIDQEEFVHLRVQIIIMAVIALTVFLRTELNTRNEQDGAAYVGALLFGMVINMFNGFSELSMMINRLQVFYKQRDLLFHPAWTFTLPSFLLKVPISMLESVVWMAVTYYTIGFAPETSRLFKQFLLVFLAQQMAAGLFRLIAGLYRTIVIANTGGALTLLLVFLLGGFIVPKREIPNWWEWAYWVSPLSYGYNAFTVNEVFAPRRMNKRVCYLAFLSSALFGFAVLFNVLFTFALTYLNCLDARAAAIVMRTVRNMKDTGRTVVCTIRQPSIDIFEAFDELLLMKRGDQSIPGVPKIKEKYNPATWMLEVSSGAAEIRLGMDFAKHYKSSFLYQRNKALVTELSTPPAGAKDLYFASQYSQSTWGQFKSFLCKQWWIYWRSPDYNLVRYFFTLVSALMIGTIFWQVGTNRDTTTDLTMIIWAMYAAVLFVGFANCSTVQPLVATERTVFYRERAVGMYSALPYALAQVACEVPYELFQTAYYILIVNAMVGFQWTATKFFWFFFVNFFSFLYFTYYGMMTVSITPNHQIAAVFAAAFYAIFDLFSGFFIPKPRIPKWWIWYYWICPLAWTVYGLILSQYGDINVREWSETEEMAGEDGLKE
ncbi:ABC transporter G family member 29 [Hibiscus syriacus]|uniref:ABC transporter G family member 29 n=1 Tax=Hibiscus syriacus TaxID=106335 RepID=A0A6A2YYU9_HIBSY|nr:ABC transporter G family member 29 [Hibiscus syriacus]